MGIVDIQAEHGVEPPAQWLRVCCFLLGWPAVVVVLDVGCWLSMNPREGGQAMIVRPGEEIAALFGMAVICSFLVLAEYRASVRLNSNWSSLMVVIFGISALLTTFLLICHLVALVGLPTDPTLPLDTAEAIYVTVVAYYLFTAAACHLLLSRQINDWKPPVDEWLMQLLREQQGK